MGSRISAIESTRGSGGQSWQPHSAMSRCCEPTGSECNDLSTTDLLECSGTYWLSL